MAPLSLKDVTSWWNRITFEILPGKFSQELQDKLPRRKHGYKATI